MRYFDIYEEISVGATYQTKYEEVNIGVYILYLLPKSRS